MRGHSPGAIGIDRFRLRGFSGAEEFHIIIRNKAAGICLRPCVLSISSIISRIRSRGFHGCSAP